MVQEEKTRGRPKIYASDAERKKAYRKRQKQRLSDLQSRIILLEEKVFKMKEAKINTNTELKAVHEELTVPHMKFTSNEIAKLDNDILIRYRKILEGNPRVNFYPVPILNPFSRILSLSVSKSKELSEAIMQTVLAYMIQAELLHREREKSTEGEIRKLLERLEKLEQEVEEKKSTS